MGLNYMGKLKFKLIDIILFFIGVTVDFAQSLENYFLKSATINFLYYKN